MNTDIYRRTKTTVSLINYHFVFCPRYRRKVFRLPGVEDYFKAIAPQILQELDVQILALECHVDHVHLFVSAPPSVSPADIMAALKGKSSRMIREKFSYFCKTDGFWTRSYFVSTAGSVSSETIQRYVETQKTRPATKKEREALAHT